MQSACSTQSLKYFFVEYVLGTLVNYYNHSLASLRSISASQVGNAAMVLNGNGQQTKICNLQARVALHQKTGEICFREPTCLKSPVLCEYLCLNFHRPILGLLQI